LSQKSQLCTLALFRLVAWYWRLTVQRDPVREWREQYARRGTQLGFEPSSDAPFLSSVRPIWDAPRIVQTRLSPGLLFRDKNMIRDGDDRLSLVLTTSSRLTVGHRGRELCLEPGDAAMFQADAPGRAGSKRGFSVIELSMPQIEWHSRGVRPGDCLMRPVRRDSEGLKLLAGYIRSLESVSASVSLDGRDLIRRHVIDLAVLAATRPESIGESDASAVVAARRAAVLDYVATRFQDPDLSIVRIASALRISPRYVQRLLETLGTSLTAYVTELRLQLAFKLLTEHGRQPRRVADVAMEVGFSDLSYFNRSFKSRFGDTPRGVRASGGH
jgi:AraC-like DNA-binding protein